tara:strand:+ start:1661 stop:2719 length:1059 start_codon:yes stop_codon:yes gene_type:complete
MITEICYRPPLKGQEGFVLVTVIGMLAIMSLVVSLLATIVDDLQRDVFEGQKAREERFEISALRETLLYLASTKSGSVAGIRLFYDKTLKEGRDPFLFRFENEVSGNELRMDGRVYVTQEQYLFSIQDAGSLISLRAENPALLQKLLRSEKFSRSESGLLVSNLLDYIDRDEEKLLDGAEKQEYRNRQRLEPTNRFLGNPWQLNNVLGWKRVLINHPDLFREISIYPGEFNNYNSMTKKRLSFVDGISDDGSSQILRYREEASFREWEEVKEISRTLNDDLKSEVNYVPSPYLRLRFSKSGSERVTWSSVTLTPRSMTKPWVLDYEFVRKIEDQDREEFAQARKTPSSGVYW